MSVAIHPTPELHESELHPDYAAHATHAAHLAPGEWHVPHFHGEPEDAPTETARQAGAHRHTQAEEIEALERLLSGPVHLTPDEVRREAARARRRARAPHRPFRPTASQFVTLGTLLALLIGVLVCQSRAVELRNRDHKLGLEIAQMGQQIAETRHAIARLDSEVNLTSLAGGLGWTPAPIANFDDVSTTRPLTTAPVDAVQTSLAIGGGH